MNARARATDKMDRSLKDRDRLGLGVTGSTVPFSEAYRGTVENVAKANAKVATANVRLIERGCQRESTYGSHPKVYQARRNRQ